MTEYRDELSDRVDAALEALRATPAIERDTASRIAARAVLANVARPRTGSMQALKVAAVAIIAVGGAAMVARFTAPETRMSAVPPSDSQQPLSVEGPTALPVASTAMRPIVFDFSAPNASSVQLLGDFNQWSRDANVMKRSADGHWRTTTMLPPGRYVYAYLVDGRVFRTDPRRDAIEDRDFGVTGSELVVGEAP
jgi:hypothetical protein